MRKTILIACVLVPILLIAGWYFIVREPSEAARKTAAAREQLRFESLDARIPKGKPIALTKPFTPAAAKRWEEHEKEIDIAFRQRAELLKALHEKTRQFFVDAPGAGSGRVLVSGDETILMSWPRVAGPQPGESFDFPMSTGEPIDTVTPDDDHYRHHYRAAFEFLNPFGFGYFKSRSKVAGFTSHGFSAQLGQNVYMPMKIDHVQLVGILVHDESAVYLTDGLPSMEQVRQGKTRRLDPFEEAGLQALRDGEDLFVATRGQTIRMVGALRATKECLKCHDAARGDLLGALTYTLRPKSKEQ